MKRYLTVGLITASVISFQAKAAWLPGMPWEPRYTFDAQAGNQRSATLDLMLPFAGNNDALWFLDPRAQLASSETNLLSMGVGYRKLIDDRYILGGFGYIDHYHSADNNNYDQVTLGSEYLSNTWDARANAYVPFGKTKHSDTYYTPPADGSYYLQGHKILLQQYTNQEIAEPGAEVEVGHSIPGVPGLRAYVGYYHFGTGGEQQKIDAPEARLDYQINNNIAFTMSEQHDHVRGNLFAVGARISFGGAPQHADRSDISNRMEDYVIRNFSVVTTSQTINDGLFTSPENVYYANNTASPGGDGTYEHPYQTVDAASSAANSDGNANNIIYIYAGDGSIYSSPSANNTITLLNGQSLIGSASPFVYRGVTLLTPTNNTPLLGERVDAASNTTITGFNIDGSDSAQSVGIYANGVSNVNISNITIDNIIGYVDNDPITSSCGGVNGCGIDIENSSNVNVSNVNIKDVSGGDGIDTGPGQNGGNAYGINVTNSSNVNVSNSTITGTIQGGNGSNGGVGQNGGDGGDAVGINIAASDATLNNILYGTITGGTAGTGGSGGSAGTDGESFTVRTTN